MLTLAQTLSYYKRKDVQRLILEYAQDKEVGTRFDESFGKRPDTLTYENDVLEVAKNGVTSFHCSEELWINPLQLNSTLKRNELDSLRKGWDLILDIDCPYWTFSKLAAYVFIKALKDHGVDSVTVKFSGSKGFHIAVPFEAFPEKKYYIDGQQKEVKDMFPEGPRKIAAYLVDYVEKNLIVVDEKRISFAKASLPISKLFEDTGKTREETIITKCNKCNSVVKEYKRKIEYVCPNCEYRLEDDDKQFMQCPKCKRIMEKHESKKSLCSCGSNSVRREFDLSQIVAVDTILIASRHLYRMPYSLHEKTGLVSVPFDIRHILKFEKEEAETKKFKPFKFLDRTARLGEAELLFQKAFDFQAISEKKKQVNKEYGEGFVKEKYSDVELNAQAIPEEYFPPCIKKISAGIEDGKKRALLVLINFLSSCNWSHEQIEDYVFKWNDRNSPDKLRDTYITGQLRYHKSQKEKLLPPNCDNRGYMIDTQFCNPDDFCKRIKNPVQYSKRKVFLKNQGGSKRKKTEKN
ncbi:MAG: DNA primase small subunit domain-containing protein [Candidatus Woesearchaeota archaeon]